MHRFNFFNNGIVNNTILAKINNLETWIFCWKSVMYSWKTALPCGGSSKVNLILVLFLLQEVHLHKRWWLCWCKQDFSTRHWLYVRPLTCPSHPSLKDWPSSKLITPVSAQSRSAGCFLFWLLHGVISLCAGVSNCSVKEIRTRRRCGTGLQLISCQLLLLLKSPGLLRYQNTHYDELCSVSS